MSNSVNAKLNTFRNRTRNSILAARTGNRFCDSSESIHLNYGFVYLAKISVRLKPSIQDPQGLAVLGALKDLGFTGTSEVRIGKYIEVALNSPDREAAEKDARAMSEKLLINPVMETFTVQIEERK